jgi:hypothetical protein
MTWALVPRFRAWLSGLQRPGIEPRELFVKLFEGVLLQDRRNEYLRREKFTMLQSAQPFVAPRDAPARVCAARSGASSSRGHHAIG